VRAYGAHLLLDKIHKYDNLKVNNFFSKQLKTKKMRKLFFAIPIALFMAFEFFPKKETVTVIAVPKADEDPYFLAQVVTQKGDTINDVKLTDRIAFEHLQKPFQITMSSYIWGDKILR